MENGINTKARLAFVAFLLIAAAAGASWFFFDASQYTTYQIRTQEPVSGLIADAPVELHGVEVGKVKSIRLIDPQSVGIVLSIDKTVPITAACRATITSRGLATRGFAGYVYVSLEGCGANAPPLAARPGEPYPSIPTAPAHAVTLDTTISQVNKNFQAIAVLLESLLDKQTIVSLKQSADSLQKVTQALAENTKKLDAIVANTERASNHFEPLLQSSQDTVKALQTQVLPEAHKTLSDLDHLSGAFSEITAKINRDPSILIRGAKPPAPGPGERQ